MVYYTSPEDVAFGEGPFGGVIYEGIRETKYEDPLIELLDALPDWYNDDEDSNNADLLAAVGEQLEQLDIDGEKIKLASMPQTARNNEQLNQIASIVGITPRKGEHVEHFRRRVLMEMLVSVSNGTVPELLNGLSTVLDTDVENIREYSEYSYGGVAELKVDKTIIDSSILSDDEITDLASRLIQPTGRLYIRKPNTFVYVSPTTYNNRTDWTDYNYGYNGTDVDGNNNESSDGGYAGVIGAAKLDERGGYGTSYGSAWGDS